jgi:hypothetical protein
MYPLKNSEITIQVTATQFEDGKNMISYCGNQTTEKNVKYETKKVT